MADVTESVQPHAQAPSTPRPAARRLGGYVAIGLGAMALGVGATSVAMRWNRSLEPPPSASADRPTTSPSVSALDDPDASNGEGGGVYISPARQRLIGVRTALVERHTVRQTIRAVGALAYDETRFTQVHTKVSGWIDQLFVDFTGKPVQKGQALFTIYSPDLVATQGEYLLARRAQGRLSASQFEETRDGAASLLAAARKRLELWDLSPQQIDALDQRGEAERTVTFYAPSSGLVLERHAIAGQYISPEMTAFTLADASQIWAIGQILESDLPRVRVGQAVTVDLANEAGSRPVQGRVSFIYPEIDPATRRARIRVDLANPHLTLKPDMFVTLTIQLPESDGVMVPSEAVIDTGDRQYVIVANGQGYFEPRVIRAGAAADGAAPVLDGLAVGDRVVTSAQFLIDSETNLQSALQAMTDMPDMTTVTTTRTGGGDASGRDAGGTAGVTAVLRTDPTAIRVGANAFEVVVTDARGAAITDADVSLVLSMPAMPSMGMPAARLRAALPHASHGLYRATGEVPAAGRWDATVIVTRAGARLAATHQPIVVR